MPRYDPQEYHEPLQGVDYTRNDQHPADTNGWRRDTPPAGEDGTVPAVSQTVTDSGVGEGGKI